MERTPIGTYLRKARLAREMSQAALAAQLGCTPGRISEWECGQRRPSAATLHALVEALGLDAAEALRLRAESAA